MDSIKAGLAGGFGALLVIAVYGILAVPVPGGQNVVASPEAALMLDFGRELMASNCNGIGAPIVNITEGILNDADSGIAGNYWGLDAFNRTIQVWKTGDKSYCALVRYTGRFAAIAGQISPGGSRVLTGKENGVVTGGYKAIITDATLLTTPSWKTNGNVGTVDYRCDADGNCPGAVNWLDQYFASGYSFDQPWWGWIYRAGGNKVWVNAITGNQGDII